jgi:hypothetical protein
MADDFDWNNDETVTVRTQMGLAVYTNPHGALVIRQEGSYPDDDVWVIFDACHARTIARRILEEAGIDPAIAFRDTHRDSFRSQTGNEHSDIGQVGTGGRDSKRDTNATAPKDKTAAERQRRRRERIARDSHAVTDRDVTPLSVTRPEAFVLKAVANG